MDEIPWKTLIITMVFAVMCYTSPRKTVDKISRWDRDTFQYVKVPPPEPIKTESNTSFKLTFPTFRFNSDSSFNSNDKKDEHSFFPQHSYTR